MNIIAETSLYLPISPISINKFYYGNKKFGKTKEAQEMSSTVLYALIKYADEMKRLRSYFDVKKHAVYVEIETLIPKHKLYTKSGVYTSQKPDISNIEKGIIDLVLLPKYEHSLQIDDRYLVGLKSTIAPTITFSGVNVRLCIVDQPTPSDN